jgi:hypothetical protein
MIKAHLIDFINKGKKFGIQLSNADSDFVGWVSVEMALVNQRIFDLLADEPDSKEYKVQKLNLEKPFCLRVAELPRDIHEGDSYPLNEHYRRNDVYRFYNIYEVEDFLQTFGYELTDLKWYVDIDHD